MLPPPVRDTTTFARIIAALVFAVAFPAIVLSQVLIWSDGATALPQRAATAASAAITALPFGAVLGWPYVLCAACAWACLHQFGRHYRSLAGVIGAITGTVVAFKLMGLQGVGALLLWPVGAALGLVTGLGVWMIAYGARKQPASPRQALTA